MHDRVLVVLPMFNEEQSITRTLNTLMPVCKENSYDVLVIDDGSSDTSHTITKAFISNSKYPNITLAQLPFNCGVGGAMRCGFTWANFCGYDCVVQFDSDGQHDPSWIPILVEQSEAFDIVIGSRFALSQKFTSRFRRITIFALSRVISYRLGYRLTDPTSGFRLTRKNAIREFSEHYPSEYLGDTLNSLVVAHSFNFRVAEIPVKMYERVLGKPSTNLVRSALYLIRSVFSILIYQSPRGRNE